MQGRVCVCVCVVCGVWCVCVWCVCVCGGGLLPLLCTAAALCTEVTSGRKGPHFLHQRETAMSEDLVAEASKFLMSRGQSGDGIHHMWPVSLGVPRDGSMAGPRNHPSTPPPQPPRIPKQAPLLPSLESPGNTCLTLV